MCHFIRMRWKTSSDSPHITLSFSPGSLDDALLIGVKKKFTVHHQSFSRLGESVVSRPSFIKVVEFWINYDFNALWVDITLSLCRHVFWERSTYPFTSVLFFLFLSFQAHRSLRTSHRSFSCCWVVWVLSFYRTGTLVILSETHACSLPLSSATRTYTLR